MRNIKITLRFDGAPFHGWQVQANAPTVQQCVQDALAIILGEKTNVTGCSRTDAGVHANCFVCNIRTEHSISCERLTPALNAHLPPGIAVLSCEEAAADFHARYDCTSKEYVYCIRNARVRDPFMLDRCLLYPHPIDADFLNDQAQDYVGTHDFIAFASAGFTVKTTVRTVKKCTVTRQGDMVYFTVEADGFLYNMVRIMVGTLLDIQAGKLPADSIPQILAGGKREAAGVTAPPQGLYLNRVFYHKEG